MNLQVMPSEEFEADNQREFAELISKCELAPLPRVWGLRIGAWGLEVVAL